MSLQEQTQLAKAYGWMAFVCSTLNSSYSAGLNSQFYILGNDGNYQCGSNTAKFFALFLIGHKIELFW